MALVHSTLTVFGTTPKAHENPRRFRGARGGGGERGFADVSGWEPGYERQFVSVGRRFGYHELDWTEREGHRALQRKQGGSQRKETAPRRLERKQRLQRRIQIPQKECSAPKLHAPQVRAQPREPGLRFSAGSRNRGDHKSPRDALGAGREIPRLDTNAELASWRVEFRKSRVPSRTRHGAVRVFRVLAAVSWRVEKRRAGVGLER